MSQNVIIDPPVHPYSAPDELRAWLHELEEKRAGLEGETELEVVEKALEDARRWLGLAEEMEG